MNLNCIPISGWVIGIWVKFQNLPPFHSKPPSVSRWQLANHQWNIQLIKLMKIDWSDSSKWYNLVPWLPCHYKLLSRWYTPSNSAGVARNLNVEKLITKLNECHNSLGYRDTFKSFCIQVSQVKGNLTMSLKWMVIIAYLPSSPR